MSTSRERAFEDVLNNLNNVFEMSLTDSSLEQSTDETEKQLSMHGVVWKQGLSTLRKPRNWFPWKNN